MKFILGLLIGAGLIFGVYYMGGGSNAELKKADAETPALAVEKAKIRTDYEVQLKAAEDQVQSLNTELLKIRTDLVTAQAKLTNMVEPVKVVEKPVSKPVVVTAPVAPVPQTVSAPPTVAQPAPQQPAPVVREPSVLRGPRAAPGWEYHFDEHGNRYRIVAGKRVYKN